MNYLIMLMTVMGSPEKTGYNITECVHMGAHLRRRYQRPPLWLLYWRHFLNPRFYWRGSGAFLNNSGQEFDHLLQEPKRSDC